MLCAYWNNGKEKNLNEIYMNIWWQWKRCTLCTTNIHSMWNQFKDLLLLFSQSNDKMQKNFKFNGVQLLWSSKSHKNTNQNQPINIFCRQSLYRLFLEKKCKTFSCMVKLNYHHEYQITTFKFRNNTNKTKNNGTTVLTMFFDSAYFGCKKSPCFFSVLLNVFLKK